MMILIMILLRYDQVENKAISLRYFDRVKGRVFQHPASINFNCGRFESGWLVYTDLIETSKVRRGHHGPKYPTARIPSPVRAHRLAYEQQGKNL